MSSVNPIQSTNAVIALPISALPSLRITIKQKLALAGVFALAGFTIVVEAIRFSILIAGTFNILHLLTWNYVASFMAIVVSDLPILRPLLFKKRFMGDSSNENTRSHINLHGSWTANTRVSAGQVTTKRSHRRLNDDDFSLESMNPKDNAVVVTVSAKVEFIDMENV